MIRIAITAAAFDRRHGLAAAGLSQLERDPDANGWIERTSSIASAPYAVQAKAVAT